MVLLPPTRLTTDKSVIVAADKGSAGSNTAKVVLDTGITSIEWDGTNNLGKQVSGGTYLIQLVVMQGSGSTTIATTSVTVMSRENDILKGVIVVPNPLRMAQSSRLVVLLNPVPDQEVQGRLYSLAGEMVISSYNHEHPYQLNFDLEKNRVASGVYIIALSAKAPWGTVSRCKLKVVVVN